eukprot:2715878-Lingulodinium_polyedra.AAC.1
MCIRDRPNSSSGLAAPRREGKGSGQSQAQPPEWQLRKCHARGVKHHWRTMKSENIRKTNNASPAEHSALMDRWDTSKRERL